MNGIKETRGGEPENLTPGIYQTFKECLGVIFFSEKSISSLYLGKNHIYNLITIFLFMIIIPYKSAFVEGVFSVGKVVEAIILTTAFICMTYFFIPRKRTAFYGFFRVALGAEVVDIFNPVSFLIPSNFVMYYNALMIGWYMAVMVLILNRLHGMPRTIGFFYIFFIFFLTNLIPGIFG